MRPLRGREPGRPQHILITGAGGALGRALARRFAAAEATLSLCDIDREVLAETARAAEKKGAVVNRAQLDVSDNHAVDRWMVHLDNKTPLDLVIANAGVSPGTPEGAIMEEQDAALAMVQTNLIGVMNTVYSAVALMAPRGRGHIVLVSSISGFNGFPRVPAYAATKAGVRVFGESLRFNLHALGIRLLIVFPGFFQSGMTATEDAQNPGEITAEDVAERIFRGVAKNKLRLPYPYPILLASRLLAAMPLWLGFALYRKLFAR